MALTIVSLKLSSEAVCGVTLEPYLQVRKGTSTTVSGEDVPEEGVSDARYVLRYRWYRSVHRGGQICWVSTTSSGRTAHLSKPKAPGICVVSHRNLSLTVLMVGTP